MRPILSLFILINFLPNLFQGVSASRSGSYVVNYHERQESKLVALLKQSPELCDQAVDFLVYGTLNESNAEVILKIKVGKEARIFLAKQERQKFQTLINKATTAYREHFDFDPIYVKDDIVTKPMRTTTYARTFWFQDPETQSYLETLSHMFPTMRQAMGDGDCFYRSFMFSLLMFHRISTPELKLRHMRLFEIVKNRYAKVDLMQKACDLYMHFIKSGTLHPIKDYEYLFNQREASNSLVFLLRILVADKLQDKDCANFMIEDQKTFIYEKVVPMGKWGGEFEISAAQKIFQISIVVTDLVHQNRMVYGESSADLYGDIEIMFTGNHYDIFEIPADRL